MSLRRDDRHSVELVGLVEKTKPAATQTGEAALKNGAKSLAGWWRTAKLWYLSKLHPVPFKLPVDQVNRRQNSKTMQVLSVHIFVIRKPAPCLLFAVAKSPLDAITHNRKGLLWSPATELCTLCLPCSTDRHAHQSLN